MSPVWRGAAGSPSASSAAHLDALGRSWDIHTLIGGSLLLLVGAQIVSLGLCAQAYVTYFGVQIVFSSFLLSILGLRRTDA